MRHNWLIWLLVPLLTTCSLNSFPPTVVLRLSTTARSPELAQMSCFAVSMRKAGLDEVSDAMTANFPHACLGLSGSISALVSYEKLLGGMEMTLSNDSYTGEILAFKSASGDCAGKTITELFSSIPEVYSVVSIPTVSVQQGATLSLAPTYQSTSALNKVTQCPRQLACAPAGNTACVTDMNVTADNFYGVYLADRVGAGARLIMSAPDDQWSSAEGANGITFSAEEYFYFVAWNASFQRAALFRLLLGNVTFESSVDRVVGTVGPAHTSDITPMSTNALTSLLASNPTWYNPRYSTLNNASISWPSIVSGMGQAKWVWLDTMAISGQTVNPDPSASFYPGPDTDPFYVVFRSKCRLIEIARREIGCR